MKKTLILGASENTSRYANMAAKRLLKYGHEIVQIGKKEGTVEENEISIGKPHFENVDTVTLYLNSTNQKEYYDYLLSLKPKRIIFNPGAENPELVALANKNNIETIEACTLVMLSIGNY